jgi:hypothetical protein
MKSIYLISALTLSFNEFVTGKCFTSLKALNDVQVIRAKAFDYDTIATYVLCPNTVFDAPAPPIPDDDAIFTDDYFYFQFPTGLIVDGNSRYLCGNDGKSSNNCTIKEYSDGGQILSQINRYNYTFKDNILVSGITLDGSKSPITSIVIASPGNITFKDCIIQVCDVINVLLFFKRFLMLTLFSSVAEF